MKISNADTDEGAVRPIRIEGENLTFHVDDERISVKGNEFYTASEYDALRSSNEALREALSKFGAHTERCYIWREDPEPCNCGLNAALNRTDGAVAEPKCETCGNDPRGIDQGEHPWGETIWVPCPDCAPASGEAKQSKPNKLLESVMQADEMIRAEPSPTREQCCRWLESQRAKHWVGRWTDQDTCDAIIQRLRSPASPEVARCVEGLQTLTLQYPSDNQIVHDAIALLRFQQGASEAELKAEKWDALMACRMRTLGGAQVADPDSSYSYIVLEFWTGHPAETDQPWLAEHFGKFIDKAVRSLRLRLSGDKP